MKTLRNGAYYSDGLNEIVIVFNAIILSAYFKPEVRCFIQGSPRLVYLRHRNLEWVELNFKRIGDL